MSGEREIRDTADALNKLNLRHTEVLPLYARLSNSEQNRVFQSHSGRRIVLATNVAETSLTVPGIKYVIDPGTARISRYSYRTKVQRLPIEPVSQASANQRKGRCGRVSEGICIRLYSEDDFLSRPEFTDPEILRTNLASVILQMTAWAAISPLSRSLKRRISAISRTACACLRSWGDYHRRAADRL
jgi:ATP-dependent helicase HrpA